MRIIGVFLSMMNPLQRSGPTYDVSDLTHHPQSRKIKPLFMILKFCNAAAIIDNVGRGVFAKSGLRYGATKEVRFWLDNGAEFYARIVHIDLGD